MGGGADIITCSESKKKDIVNALLISISCHEVREHFNLLPRSSRAFQSLATKFESISISRPDERLLRFGEFAWYWVWRIGYALVPDAENLTLNFVKWSRTHDTALFVLAHASEGAR